MIRVEVTASHLFSREKTVADFLRIDCETVRRFKNRRTGRFERNGRTFYIKMHEAGGWKPILEDLLRFRRPQIGARAEWRALRSLEKLGIPAAKVAAFGEEGRASPWQRSFLVTEAIPATVSLEKLAQRSDAPAPGSAIRRRLIRGMAEIARALHTGGINHRDFYLCHFLLDASEGTAISGRPKLYLLDLHRAQKRRRVPERWIVKDLGGLLFSAIDAAPTPRELLLFLRMYSNCPAKKELAGRKALWRSVRNRAEKLYEKLHPRLAATAAHQIETFAAAQTR